MRTATRAKVETALREEWLHTVLDLKNQIKIWASQEEGWTFTRHEEREVDEVPLGTYTVEVWRLETPQGEVRLEPVARNFPGHGIVELYAWPTAYRVRLIQAQDDQWRVLTDSGIYLHQPWDREHFKTLVQDLMGVVDMIPGG